MPCPKSPEGGYHRYQLPGEGRTLATRCVYCGQARVFRPFDDPASQWTTKPELRTEPLDAETETTDGGSA
jgi:hypothetical protein